jgi:hypothetical protein
MRLKPKNWPQKNKNNEKNEEHAGSESGAIKSNLVSPDDKKKIVRLCDCAPNFEMRDRRRSRKIAGKIAGKILSRFGEL